jgi:hypothetical protein
MSFINVCLLILYMWYLSNMYKLCLVFIMPTCMSGAEYVIIIYRYSNIICNCLHTLFRNNNRNFGTFESHAQHRTGIQEYEPILWAL